MNIILASQSPRRRALLGQIGLTNLLVRPPQGEETADPSLPPEELVQALCRQKAQEVAQTAAPEDAIIAADTIVVLDGQVLGKPRDGAEATRMLSMLAGRVHAVYTGVTVRQGEKILTRVQKTSVRMRPLSPAEIASYLATNEPMDKAGGYGIQGVGALLVEEIQGDYFNVVGLPLCLLGGMLAEFDIHPLTGGKEGRG